MATHVEHIKQGKTGRTGVGISIRGSMARVRQAVSRVVTVDEDAIFKSKDWPHMWPKK